jgi:Tol biopolymer transport system component
MSLSGGVRLGPYEILSPLGAGGMGEVYRAHDTKLNRDVALKVLLPEVADNPERLARFRREAQILASLNHPNIAHIYGLEEGNGVVALVLELVEGPTLADRIARGAIPLDEALPIARQIAEALEAAHEQGVVHRDLKPANIKVRADGTVKVLDFGLAKALEPIAIGGPAAALTNSPTITSPALMTGVGVLLGTAAYMSPEQAKGRPADKRSDIWAFGCVLYEMLTAKRAFPGEDVGDTFAAVLRGEPDLAVLPRPTPTAIVRLLYRALAKDPQLRLPHVGVARLEIHDALTQPATLSGAAPPHPEIRWRMAIPWVVAALTAAGLVIGARVGHIATTNPLVMRLDVNLPRGVELFTRSTPNLALSPDGTRLAFLGSVNGLRRVYVRHFDQPEASPLNGTETAASCFFSPDGRAIGFMTIGRSLGTVSLADGLVVMLASDVDYRLGATWDSNDRITFARRGVLWQVAASGGSPVQVTTLDPAKHEVIQGWPTAIARGDILFTSVTDASRPGAHIEALHGKDRHVLIESATFPLYAASGHLVFFRDGALLAVPFDAARLEVRGQPVRVMENVPVDGVAGQPFVAMSSSGGLASAPLGSGTSRLVWVSRQGVETPINDDRRNYQTPRIAPDDHRLAVQAGGDLWLYDSTRAGVTSLTSKDSVGATDPVWTRDGKRIFFQTFTGMRWIDTDGSGRSKLIPDTSMADLPTSVSPDGETLLFIRQTTDRQADIYALSLQGEPNPHVIISTPGYDGAATFSPEGQWLAYASDESGQMQVYLHSYRGSQKIPISSDGGTQPVWSRNGKELFYRVGNKVMAVDVILGPNPTPSRPHPLFEQRYAFNTTTISNYDVSSDGQRFLMVKDESESGRLSLVLNWFEELKARVPTK